MKLQIERGVYGGTGLSHQIDGEDAGKAVFVPFTLPGEVVEAKFVDEQRSLREVKLIEVLSASADRVAPGCIHYGKCGGCQYQHADYTAQIAMKTDILRETLNRAGLTALPEIHVHAGDAWRYRNRARLRIEEINGVVQVGYNRRGTNEFLEVHECPILAPLLWRAAKALTQLAAESSTAGRWATAAAEAEFFTDRDETKLQLTMFVRKDRAAFTEFCSRLQELVPELVGAGASLLLAQGAQRQIQKPRQFAAWSAEGLNYTVGAESYWVSRGSFFQVNRFLIDELVQLVTQGRKGALAWDLYAGVGLFSRTLARGFKQVVAVEAAGRDLATSFRGAGKRAVETTTVEFLQGAVVQREHPDLIVMDPPRAGVGTEVCALLARVSAAELVYVSCDPVTLARDLKLLVEADYRLIELHMVDMFPQTFHLETVVVLRKESH